METYQRNVTVSAWNAAEKRELVRGVLRDIRAQLERQLLHQLNNATERLNERRRGRPMARAADANESDATSLVDVMDNTSESALTQFGARGGKHAGYGDAHLDAAPATGRAARYQ